MGRFKRMLGREPEPETPCPRCGIPVPHGDVECNACGWDTRELYAGAKPGSFIGAADGGAGGP